MNNYVNIYLKNILIIKGRTSVRVAPSYKGSTVNFIFSKTDFVI